MTIARAVLINVTASAPWASAAPATSARSATVGLSLAHSGTSGPLPATADRTSAVAVGEWANMWRRSSTFGQLTLTSMAATPSTPTSSDAALAKSSTRWPQMLTTTRAPVAASRGRSSRTQASMPGPCRPTLLTMPAPAWCTRGEGLPGHGSTDRDLTTMAPNAASGP